MAIGPRAVSGYCQERTTTPAAVLRTSPPPFLCSWSPALWNLGSNVEVPAGSIYRQLQEQGCLFTKWLVLKS